MLTGTPGFQPPEQLRSESIGLISDVYALGAVLLVLFSEKPVCPKLSPYQIMFKVTVSGEKPDTTLLPSQLREVCRTCFRDVALRPKAQWVLQGYCMHCVKRTVIITKNKYNNNINYIYIYIYYHS